MKKIVIIKLGTTIATTKRRRLDAFRMHHIALQIHALQQQGFGVILVVSAAVTCGMGITRKHAASSLERQLVAGIGQAHAIGSLYEIFAKVGLYIAQLLLTKEDVLQKKRKENVIQVIQLAWAEKVIVAVNENDILDLNSFGGNDFLALQLAKITNASHILFLSDTDGVYDKDMHVIKFLSVTKRTVFAKLLTQHKRVAIGGIRGKVQAAKIAARKGLETFIVHGQTQDVLTRILLENEHIGTKIVGGTL